MVWADSAPEYNAPTNWGLHTSFKLSKTNGQIGFFAPDGRMVDGFSYGQQIPNMSTGRFPDGGPPPFYGMASPTPAAPNSMVGANTPPQLSPIGDRTVSEQTVLTFTAAASDPNSGQHLTFSLGADAPAGASIDPTSGVFLWTPTEAQGPGSYRFAVRVTDDGTPALTVLERITVTVNEVNRAPVLTAVGPQQVNEGSLFQFQLVASDPDIPTNTLTFSLPQGGPIGLSLDPVQGLLSWTPTEAQGPGQYNIVVRFTDNGSPSLFDEKSFQLTVNEVNNPPVITPILPQVIEELSTFTYYVKATDPDNPPSTITYRFDTAPSGAQIDSATGVITWTPTEAQGPTNVVFVVRATESNPPNLSSAVTFGVVVTEKNQAPTLAPLADVSAVEGRRIRLQAQGSDSDLPAQTLTYSLLPGAPSAATIDAATGRFDWLVDPDFGASTNTISVQVTDSGPGSLSATQTFAVVVVPRWHAVLSEVMYRPKATNAEFVELQNNSLKTTVNLSGIRMSGSNLVFNFTNGTSLPPGARLLVVKNPAAFSAAYPGAGPVVGQYSGQLGTNGDTLQLVKPGASPAEDVVLHELTYRAALPWPTAANGGSGSLQIIDPTRDANRVGNWAAVPTNGLPTAPQWQQVTATGTYTGGNPWLYLYLLGPGTVYVDDVQLVVGSTPGVGQNLIQNDGFESPLSSGWNTTANTAQSTSSPTEHHSGNYSLRLVCSAGGSTQSDSLWQSIPGLVNGTTYSLSYWYLPSTNGGTLTVRFSGFWINTSPNLLFTPPPAVTQFTPGATNNVAAGLPDFPFLRINEIQTRNLTGIVDRTGQHEPWIELVNTGFDDLGLDGLYLTMSYSSLTNWAFPSGWVLPAGGYLVIFADGQPLETTATELHTSFRLPTAPASAFTVALSTIFNGKPVIVDYLNGVAGVDDASYGLAFDGWPASAGALSTPTPGAGNLPAPPPVFTGIGYDGQGRPVLVWTAVPGRTYRVEYKDDLGQGAWSNLGSVTASGSEATVVDTTSAGVQKRFYRLVNQ
jgi:hypothetical protein